MLWRLETWRAVAEVVGLSRRSSGVLVVAGVVVVLVVAEVVAAEVVALVAEVVGLSSRSD